MSDVESRRAESEAYSRLFEEAGREAVKKALQVHKALGESIAVMVNGEVKLIPAKEIAIPA